MQTIPRNTKGWPYYSTIEAIRKFIQAWFMEICDKKRQKEYNDSCFIYHYIMDSNISLCSFGSEKEGTCYMHFKRLTQSSNRMGLSLPDFIPLTILVAGVLSISNRNCL